MADKTTHEAELAGGKQIPEVPQLAGSVFINNTSYSGADIKVMVHLYRTDFAKKASKQADRELADAEDVQAQLDSKISKIQADLQTVHTGTREDLILRKQLSKYKKSQTSIEGSVEGLDHRANRLSDAVPNAGTKVLAEAQTLSASIHRDKQAVRACGSVYPKGFTRGPRQIAGSIIFTVFDEHVLYQFLDSQASEFDSNTYTSALMDQLPPVDIILSFANEYGSSSRMTIYGVEFVNEGQTMSIEDILTENVVQFVARDIDPMRSVAKRTISEHQILLKQSQPKRASDLLLEEDYKALKDGISPYERFSRRRNPFL